LELIALYPDRAELFREFPDLTDEDLTQVRLRPSHQGGRTSGAVKDG
jgi:hypothetical protein